MKLRIADMLPVSKEITLGMGTVVAKPLGLTDIIRLLSKYREEFVALYVESQKEKPDFSLFAASSDLMVSEIIARALGRADELEDILALPGTVKVTLFSDVWLLSVPDPKKLVEAVAGVLGQLTRLRIELAARQNSLASNSEKSSTPSVEAATG